MFERIKRLFKRDRDQQPQPAVLRHEVAKIDEKTAEMVFSIMLGESHFVIIGRGETAKYAVKDMDYQTLFNTLRRIAENDKAFKEEVTNWVIDLNR